VYQRIREKLRGAHLTEGVAREAFETNRAKRSEENQTPKVNQDQVSAGQNAPRVNTTCAGQGGTSDKTSLFLSVQSGRRSNPERDSRPVPHSRLGRIFPPSTG